MKAGLARLLRGLADAIDPPRPDERRECRWMEDAARLDDLPHHPPIGHERMPHDGYLDPDETFGGWGGPYIQPSRRDSMARHAPISPLAPPQPVSASMTTRCCGRLRYRHNMWWSEMDNSRVTKIA